MRIVDVRKRLQVDLQYGPVTESFHRLHLPLVVLCERLREIIRLFSGELLLQHVRAQSLGPERVCFREIDRARRIVAVERVAVVPGKIEWRGSQRLFHERGALLVPLEIALENHSRWMRVTRFPRRFRELRHETMKLGDVTLKK